MLIADNDEEKRSQIWRVVTTIATVLIILIFAFFVIKMFTNNPLTGSWVEQGSNLSFEVKKDVIQITTEEAAQGETITYDMQYDMDMDKKTLELHMDEEELGKVLEAYKDVATETELKQSIQSFETKYGYSLDGQELTLTDQEYGEQMVFDKQQ